MSKFKCLQHFYESSTIQLHTYFCTGVFLYILSRIKCCPRRQCVPTSVSMYYSSTAVCINCSRTQVSKVSPDRNSASLDAADATNIIIFPGIPEPKIQYLEKYSKPGKSGLSQAQPVGTPVKEFRTCLH